VAQIDALLLPGGDDFLPPDEPADPSRYTPVPPRQLAFDRALLACARERGLPVLGVCYGMQLIALASGGDLIYDLATEAPEAGAHQLADAETHPLVWDGSGSRLAEVVAPLPRVNSRHHQAVQHVGPELRVVARAPDGVIEAIEARSGPFCAGVQWHPEDAIDGHAERLFGALVDSARRTRSGPLGSGVP